MKKVIFFSFNSLWCLYYIDRNKGNSLKTKGDKEMKQEDIDSLMELYHWATRELERMNAESVLKRYEETRKRRKIVSK